MEAYCDQEGFLPTTDGWVHRTPVTFPTPLYGKTSSIRATVT